MLFHPSGKGADHQGICQFVQKSSLPLFKLPQMEVSRPEREHMHQYRAVDDN